MRLFEDVQFYISIPPENVKKLKVFWRFRGHRNGTLDMFWTPYIRSVHQLCPWELIIWAASFYEYSFNAPVSSHISSEKWKLSLEIAAKKSLNSGWCYCEIVHWHSMGTDQTILRYFLHHLEYLTFDPITIKKCSKVL